MMNNLINFADFSKYKLFIFDFDGVIADSLGFYRRLDQSLIKNLYDVDESLKNIEELYDAIRMKTVNNSEEDYYLEIDKNYGDGNKPIDEIINKLYELAPSVQKYIEPKNGAIETLEYLRKNFDAPIALATGSGRQDINFFSSEDSIIGCKLNLNDFFDMIITSEDVKNQKPNPEIFSRTINHFGVNPKFVLIFEDSLAGVLAGKNAGATVVAIEDDHNLKNKNKIIELADFYLENWDRLFL